MANYNINLLDSGGHIVSGTRAECASDREACALARRLLNVNGQAEIWAGHRRVGQVSPTSAAEIELLGQP